MSAVQTGRQRADRGDGSVKLIQTGKHKGKWRVRLTYRDRWNRAHDLDKIVRTQRDGKHLLKEFRREVENGGRREVEYTLAQWFDWLKANDWPGDIKEQTIQYRTFRFNKHVKPILGDMPLSAIRPMMVKDFYRELVTKRVGQSTVQEVKRDLVGMFNKAIGVYEIFDGSNPFANIKVEAPALREGVALTPVLATEGIKKLRKAVDEGVLPEWTFVAVALALYAGLRRGEILALDESQFDFEQGLITVDRAVAVANGKQTIGLPKCDKTRSVVLAPTLATWVKEYLVGRETVQTLLFPSEKGTPLQVYRLSDAWKEAIKTAEFPAGMILHDCRLTHNNWIEKLMPEVSDSTRLAHLGHSANGVNLRYYTRELTPAMDILRRALEILITPI